MPSIKGPDSISKNYWKRKKKEGKQLHLIPKPFLCSNITKPPKGQALGTLNINSAPGNRAVPKAQAAHSVPQPCRTTAPAANALCSLSTGRSWGKPLLLNPTPANWRTQGSQRLQLGPQTTKQSGHCGLDKNGIIFLLVLLHTNEAKTVYQSANNAGQGKKIIKADPVMFCGL